MGPLPPIDLVNQNDTFHYFEFDYLEEVRYLLGNQKKVGASITSSFDTACYSSKRNNDNGGNRKQQLLPLQLPLSGFQPAS